MREGKLGVNVIAGLSAILIADPLDLGPHRFAGRNTRLFPSVNPDIGSEIKGALLRRRPHGKRDRDRVLLAVLGDDRPGVRVGLKVALKKILGDLLV
jgi:hypothetical protein